MRILIVEDELQLAEQLSSALSEAGYAVDHAADGERGEFLGRTEGYDAVILHPTKLTHNRNRVMDSLKKYFAINRMVLDLIPPGGLLLTCS